MLAASRQALPPVRLPYPASAAIALVTTALIEACSLTLNRSLKRDCRLCKGQEERAEWVQRLSHDSDLACIDGSPLS